MAPARRHVLMPSAIIADDEPLMRAQLTARLREAWPELVIAGEAAHGAEALELVLERRPDVAFLDIRMPVHSGLDVAREIGDIAQVVFVTAYDEYAVRAFEDGAVDYVLKPVTAERLAKVVTRVQARLAAARGGPGAARGDDTAPQAPVDLAALLARLAPREAPDARLRWIRASLGNDLTLIHVDDVLYFQAQDKYTRVVTAQAEALIRKPIRELYDALDPEAFWQIHRGTIVNLRAIDKVTRDWRDQPVIALTGRAERLMVSRTFAHRFKAM
jgi:DNA-binding LytR/AlgR family response regulator